MVATHLQVMEQCGAVNVKNVHRNFSRHAGLGQARRSVLSFGGAAAGGRSCMVCGVWGGSE